MSSILSENTFKMKRSDIYTLYQTTQFWTSQIGKTLQVTKKNVIQKLIFVLGRIENIVGKGENAGYFFPIMFSKDFFFRVVKNPDCVLKTSPQYFWYFQTEYWQQTNKV